MSSHSLLAQTTPLSKKRKGGKGEKTKGKTKRRVRLSEKDPWRITADLGPQKRKKGNVLGRSTPLTPILPPWAGDYRKENGENKGASQISRKKIPVVPPNALNPKP